MAKKPPKRGPGRPESETPLDARVMVRFDGKARGALGTFGRRFGLSPSAAVRLIVMERLRGDGLLK
jgi:hypothetical protein